jgi:hypothetical protein
LVISITVRLEVVYNTVPILELIAVNSTTHNSQLLLVKAFVLLHFTKASVIEILAFTRLGN